MTVDHAANDTSCLKGWTLGLLLACNGRLARRCGRGSRKGGIRHLPTAGLPCYGGNICQILPNDASASTGSSTADFHKVPRLPCRGRRVSAHALRVSPGLSHSESDAGCSRRASDEILITVPLVFILCCLLIAIVKVSRLLKVCHFNAVPQDTAYASKASAELTALLALVCDELQIAPA